MEELLTIQELAGRLKVSPWTIRSWCGKSFVPYFKLHGLVRFRVSEIEKWLRQTYRAGRSVYRLRQEIAERASELAQN